MASARFSFTHLALNASFRLVSTQALVCCKPARTPPPPSPSPSKASPKHLGFLFPAWRQHNSSPCGNSPLPTPPLLHLFHRLYTGNRYSLTPSLPPCYSFSTLPLSPFFRYPFDQAATPCAACCRRCEPVCTGSAQSARWLHNQQVIPAPTPPQTQPPQASRLSSDPSCSTVSRSCRSCQCS